MKTIKTLNIIAIVLLILTGLNALAAGFSMIVDPSGNGLGMKADVILQYSPFVNFLIPGIVLFSTIGIFCIITSVFTIKLTKNYEWLMILQGAIITGWILIQVIFLREFNWLHASVGSIGIYLIASGYFIQGNIKTKPFKQEPG